MNLGDRMKPSPQRMFQQPIPAPGSDLGPGKPRNAVKPAPAMGPRQGRVGLGAAYGGMDPNDPRIGKMNQIAAAMSGGRP